MAPSRFKRMIFLSLFKNLYKLLVYVQIQILISRASCIMSNSQLDCSLCKVELTCTCYMRGGPSCVGPFN